MPPGIRRNPATDFPTHDDGCIALLPVCLSFSRTAIHIFAAIRHRRSPLGSIALFPKRSLPLSRIYVLVYILSRLGGPLLSAQQQGNVLSVPHDETTIQRTLTSVCEVSSQHEVLPPLFFVAEEPQSFLC